MVNNIIKNLKTRTYALKKQITVIFYSYKDPELKFLPKIFAILTVAYTLSPIDLIPDFIPIFGYLDDIIIIPILITICIKLIPEDILTRAKFKAENEPVELKKNWFFAIIFIFLWGCSIYYIIKIL